MKDISREINSLLMELDDATSMRNECDTLSKIEKLASEYRLNLCRNDHGHGYYMVAHNIMIEDIKDYLNWHKKHFNYPGYEDYTFITWANYTGNKSLSVNFYSPDVESKSLRNKVTAYKHYNIFEFLKNHDAFIGDNYRNLKYMTKEEYDKFLELREEIKNYFLPYINDIIRSMAEDVKIKGE